MPEPLARVLRTSPSGGNQNHCWAPWAAVACPVEHHSEEVAQELALGKPGVVEAMPHAWVGSTQAAVDKTDSRVVEDDGVGQCERGVVREECERGVGGEEVGGCRDMLEEDPDDPELLVGVAAKEWLGLGDMLEEVQAAAFRLESTEREPRSKAGDRLFSLPSIQASMVREKPALPPRCQPHVRVGAQAWGSVHGSPLLS